MRYLSNIYFQKKPPNISSPITRVNKSIYQLMVIFLLQAFAFQAIGQVTFIDCECEMQPFIKIDEASGIESNDATICEGETATITGNGGVHYEWSTGETTQSITIMEGGLYTVTITDNTNCQAIESVLIQEHSKPFLVFDPSFCSGTSTRIQVNGAVFYTWENGLMNQPLEVTTGGTYTVTINDINGCTYVETATVEVLPTPVAQINIKDGNGNDLGNNTEICKGESAIVEVTSGYASYVWSPTDGLSNTTSSMTVASPDVTTTYTVTVTDNNGCTTIATSTIVVNEIITSISPNTNICLGESTQLVASGGVSYSWSPADGLSSTTVSNPIASPTTTTTYSVFITNDKGCTETKQVTVGVNRTNTSVGSPTRICFGERAILSATGGVSYVWSPTAGLGDANISNPMASPSSTTTYSVLITDANGCTAIETQTVEVVAVNVEIQGANAICEGTSTTLVATPSSTMSASTFTYAWSASANNSTTSSVLVSPSATTVYAVTVTDQNGCTAIDEITLGLNTLQVNPGPTQLICLGASTELNATVALNGAAITNGVSYNWSPTVGISNPAIPNPIVDPASTTTYSVTATDANGCMAVGSVLVTVNDLQIEAGDSQLICLGNSAQLGTTATVNGTTITSGISYTWSPTLGVDDPTAPNPVVTPTIATTYVVTATDTNGCTAIDSVVVTVNDLQIDAGADQLICLGNSAQLSATATVNGTTITDSISYAWSPTIGVDDPTAFDPIVTPTSTTTYLVTATDANGCTAVDSIEVTVNDLQIDAGDDQAICLGNSTQLTPSLTVNSIAIPDSTITFAWSPTAGVNDPTAANPTVSPTTTTTYFVSITDSNGCTAVDSIEIVVNDFQIAAGPDQAICMGDSTQLVTSVTLNGSAVSDAGITYSWSPTTRISDTTSADPIVFPTRSTNYTVTAVDSNGCVAIDTVFVEVNSGPVVFLGIAPQAINYFDTALVIFIQNSPTPITDYIWSPARYLDCPNDSTLNCAQPIFRDSIGLDSTFSYSVIVVDENGCTAESNVNINVNINNVAAPIPVMTALSGSIFMENGNKVEESMIHLNGSNKAPLATDETGQYKFEDIPMYQNYVLEPLKQSMSYDGVSIADLILINKHILGIELLDSPYKIIAADVNHSNAVTIYDVLLLRQALLEKQPTFTDNTSWRFIDADYEFLDKRYPLQEDFPETYTIESLNNEMEQLDFIAVKVGDVNNSAKTNSLVSNQSRSFEGVLSFTIRPLVNDEEQTITYQFFPKDFDNIEGYQFSIDYDDYQLAFKELKSSKLIGDQHFGWKFLDRGTITTCWYKTDDSKLSAEEPLFSLVFETETEEVLPLDLSSSIIQMEAYGTNGERLSIKGALEQTSLQLSYSDLTLFQNEPNPFQTGTSIGFYLPQATQVELTIIDNTGKVILTQNDWYSKGHNKWLIHGEELTGTGVLYYQLKTPTTVLTKKMLYVK